MEEGREEAEEMYRTQRLAALAMALGGDISVGDLPVLGVPSI